ncbi:hypothetical protein CROQUDRAFT_77967 [Cronartium quercuum f. sp. fusiforme G11]|uniref:tRNA (guanine(9)-N1)-methyltransferase n=1 Tax=Cronartium quercuum f. sp. fusiforme G11 TaxID=708437 RepID=A0A9P6TC12_9BASI|nr:hypothetical protein CROQUDRAFT_77967 [Cronartium quercuum f. sp. fusiforme G11]
MEPVTELNPNQSSILDSEIIPSNSNSNEIKKSKNQIKRELKQEKKLLERPKKRAEEKARKKQRKIQNKLKNEDVNLIKKNKLNHQQTIFNSKIIFDCSFDIKMSPKDIISLDRQLSHSYSVNRKSQIRFTELICTSFNGKLKQKMELNGNQHLRWKNFNFSEISLKDFIQNDQQDVIYLTADSPNIITNIDTEKVYVIGAIVDHNRYKNLCYDIAEEMGIQHAQLPIGKYMAEMKSRKVLTVNQVLEIMLCWLKERDWRIAFERVIPIRKLTNGSMNQTVLESEVVVTEGEIEGINESESELVII